MPDWSLFLACKSPNKLALQESVMAVVCLQCSLWHWTPLTRANERLRGRLFECHEEISVID